MLRHVISRVRVHTVGCRIHMRARAPAHICMNAPRRRSNISTALAVSLYYICIIVIAHTNM